MATRPAPDTAPEMVPAPEQDAAPKKEKKGFRRIPFKYVLVIGIAFIVGFLIFGVVAIQVWEYSNSLPFCANACHDVHPEEIHAFEDSYHANIKCTECHMGRLGTINSILLKASHFRHLPEVIFDVYDRPVESETMRPANESCELCHWPPAFHGDTVRKITRFEPDEENTQRDTYLILKTGAGTRDEGLGYGIHWHITNPVEYISTDEHKQEIPWVRTTLPDGRTIEYQDVTNPLTPEEIKEAETKVMDCVDCHNRLGHPFPPPEDLVDEALADGRLSSDLPNVKRLMLELITNTYATQDEALEAVTVAKAQYVEDYPEIAAQYPDDIDQAEALAEQIVARLVFEEPGVTWKDFPDQNKHKEFPGCFRCHDGKHLNDDGEAIRLQCNLCHGLPATVGGGERPPQLPMAYTQEPDPHLEPNFVADHRFQADESCEECHGENEFGADDSSFCANSACHGTAWPAVELDAAFPHPIELEGKHAEAWCHDCHAGERQPEYLCANCHEPPEPHFGSECQDCHTPAGFEGADMGDFQHPVALEGAHADAGCADCHVLDKELAADCSGCHEPPADHLAGECDACHAPTGFEESAAQIVALAPEISHELEGRDDCLMCHDPEGQVIPAPSNHADYAIEQCVLCHKAGE
jgi:hypothetical protein